MTKMSRRQFFCSTAVAASTGGLLGGRELAQAQTHDAHGAETRNRG